MQPEDRDLSYLWDMREAARDVREFVKDETYEHFYSNKMMRYAVERRIEVIGEAAAHVSDKFREEHPEIPWTIIIGQRNVLAHEYGEILLNRVWRVATEKIPELLLLLEPLIPPLQEI